MENPTPAHLPLQRPPTHHPATLHTPRYAHLSTYETSVAGGPGGNLASVIHSRRSRAQPTGESPDIVEPVQNALELTEDRSARAAANSMISNSEGAKNTQQPPITRGKLPAHRETIQGMHRFERAVSDETHRRFQYVIQRLNEPLASYLRKSRHEYRPTAMRLMFLGHDGNSARPWVVVLCPERVKKRAERFFKEDMVRRVLQPDESETESFRVAVVGHAPRPRGSTNPTISVAHPSSGRRGIWPTKIRSSYDGNDHYATVDGFLVATNHDGVHYVYWLTTNHGITPITRHTQSARNFLGNNCLSGLSSSDSEDETHPDDRSDTNSEKETVSGGPSESEGDLVWLNTGRLSDVSFSRMALDGDWALIQEMNDENLCQFTSGRNLGTVLGTVGEEQALSIGVGDPWEDKWSETNCRLSETSSMIITPSGHSFVPAHILLPDDGFAIQNGDSGTWVVSKRWDSELLPMVTVYGQIIADDVFGDIYMIPMSKIIGDMETLLDATVSLPRSSQELQKALLTQIYREQWQSQAQPRNASPSLSPSSAYDHGSNFNKSKHSSGNVVVTVENKSSEPRNSPVGRVISYQEENFEPPEPGLEQGHNSKKAPIQEPWTESEDPRLRQMNDTEDYWNTHHWDGNCVVPSGIDPLYSETIPAAGMYQQPAEMMETVYPGAQLLWSTYSAVPAYGNVDVHFGNENDDTMDIVEQSDRDMIIQSSANIVQSASPSTHPRTPDMTPASPQRSTSRLPRRRQYKGPRPRTAAQSRTAPYPRPTSRSHVFSYSQTPPPAASSAGSKKRA